MNLSNETDQSIKLPGARPRQAEHTIAENIVSLCVSLEYLANTPDIDRIEQEQEALYLHNNLLAVQNHLDKQGLNNNPIYLRRFIFEHAERHVPVFVGPRGEVRPLEVEKIFPNSKDWFSFFAGANNRALDYGQVVNWVNKH